DVEVVGEGAGGEGVGRADAVRAGVARPVHRAVDYRRLAPDVLHDVYLAAVGPARRLDVVAEHPEGRPHPLPVRNTDARLEAAVRLLELTLRLEARGGVLALAVPAAVLRRERLLGGGDDEVAGPVRRGVLRAAGV